MDVSELQNSQSYQRIEKALARLAGDLRKIYNLHKINIDKLNLNQNKLGIIQSLIAELSN